MLTILKVNSNINIEYNRSCVYWQISVFNMPLLILGGVIKCVKPVRKTHLRKLKNITKAQPLYLKIFGVTP